MKLLKNKTITYIHIVAMFIMLIFVLLFTMLVIYEEYNDFDRESSFIRVAYIKKQKETIKFDVNRILNFIEHKYKNRDISISESILKLEIIDTIEHLYGRKDGTGYIFIYNFNGTKLSDPIQPNNIGKNLYHFKDLDGVEVIKNLIYISQKQDGGFVQYRWTKPITSKNTLKISYAKSFNRWNWMVGTGVYLDEVEKLISADKIALKKRLIKYVMEILSLTVILFGIGLIGIIIINYIISREIDIFSDFFQKASKSYTTIDEDKIHLIRFKKMVVYINAMVTEIHKQKDKLENKVAQKTEDLNYLLKKQDSFIKHSIHEINTPLAVIMTHIDIFKIKFGENKYLSKIEAGAKMIANIYDDLGYMVKADNFIYEKKYIDFSQFLENRIEFFKEIAIGNRHNIVVNIQKDVKIYFNEVELQRVIDNNLSNAIKYARKDSDIMIKFYKESNHIVLEFKTKSYKIKDTDKIFEAFHREEHIINGFGLGLEIVDSICKKNSIKIEVSSDDEFTIFSYLFLII